MRIQLLVALLYLGLMNLPSSQASQFQSLTVPTRGPGWAQGIVIRLSGDVTYDCKVDVLDASTLASAYGSVMDGPNWNPLADLTFDGTVDILDASIVAAFFGTQCALGG